MNLKEANSLIERFHAKHTVPEDAKADSCWAWTGSRIQGGYGMILAENGNELAHRVSYRMYVGDIPEGLFVCHKCDNRWCVNPDHLFAGTHAENMADMTAKGRQGKKLNRVTASEIRKAIRAGHESQRSIARKFGVSPQLVTLIKQGRVWLDV